MDGLLLYFSGTGNTKHIAQTIKSEFENNNYKIDIETIEKSSKLEMNKYNFLVLGYPVYFMYTPIFFIDYIKNNISRSIKEKKVIIFATISASIKSDFRELEEILYEKNYKVVMTKTFRMPNNYNLDGKHNLTNEDKLNNIINKSKYDARFLVRDFIKGKYKKEMMIKFLGKVFKRRAYKNIQLDKEKSKGFSVDNTCTECMLCKNSCPSKNISFINNKIIFNDKCILCTRCINICPVNAILYNGVKRKQYEFLKNK